MKEKMHADILKAVQELVRVLSSSEAICPISAEPSILVPSRLNDDGGEREICVTIKYKMK